MIRSLKTRIAVWYIALSTSVLIGFGLCVYLILTHHLRQERKDVVTGYAERIRAFALSQSLINRQEHFLHEFDERFSLKLEREYLQISTPGGAPLYLSPNLNARPLPFKPELATAGQRRLLEAAAFADRQPVLMTVVPIVVASRLKGESF